MSWLNCGVTTQALWPKEKKEVKYGNHTLLLMPLTKEHSASVHIPLKGIRDVEGLRSTLPEIKEIQQKEGDAADYLYKSGRCAVAHAFANPIVDPDDETDLRRLSEDLWLMRNITAHLIKKNFGIDQSIWA